MKHGSCVDFITFYKFSVTVIIIKAILHGVNGKMGSVVVSMAQEHGCEVVAGVDSRHKPNLFPVFSDIRDCTTEADVIIDFSTAWAVPNLLRYAESNNMPLVICTTGLSDEIMSQISLSAQIIPIFMSANMSLGVNLLVSLAKKAAAILSESGFDIEIIEKHHNQKIDAPSGTALLFGNAINDELGGVYEFEYDRTSSREKRTKQEIGIHSIRGGTIVGEHSVIFAGKDEVVELTHSAMSKEIFAVGALRAAKFLVGKSAGLYDMQDLLG